MEGAPRVEVRRSARRTRTATAFRERDAIVVVVPQRISAADERRTVTALVAKVLAREAAAAPPGSDADLRLRADVLAERYLDPALGTPVRAASVRWVTNQQHRWGSCTPATRTIRISHRLRAVPSWVVDYVLVHELAHLAEPGHDARFWSLVEALPDAARARGYLEGYQAGQGRPAPEDADDCDGDGDVGDGADRAG